MHLDHAALEGFQHSEQAGVDHAIHNEWWLGRLEVAIEEFLYQPDVFRAIQATTTH